MKDKGEPPEDIDFGYEDADQLDDVIDQYGIKKVLDRISDEEIQLYLREKKLKKLIKKCS